MVTAVGYSSPLFHPSLSSSSSCNHIFQSCIIAIVSLSFSHYVIIIVSSCHHVIFPLFHFGSSSLCKYFIIHCHPSSSGPLTIRTGVNPGSAWAIFHLLISSSCLSLCFDSSSSFMHVFCQLMSPSHLSCGTIPSPHAIFQIGNNVCA